MAVIASSRAAACKNASDRRGVVTQGPAPRPRHVESARPPRGVPVAVSGRSTKTSKPPADEISQADSRTTIPVEVEQAVTKQCLAACPVPSDPDPSDKLAGYRDAVCHETCMVKHLSAASPNRDQYEREAERDLDVIHRGHAEGQP